MEPHDRGLDIARILTDAGGVGALVQITDNATGKTFLPCYDGNRDVLALLNADSMTGTLAAAYDIYWPKVLYRFSAEQSANRR